MWNDFKYTDLIEIPPAKKPCFLAGTLIKTVKGLIPIEQIKVNDYVYSYNFKSLKSELKSVSELFVSSCDKYIEISTTNDIIKATGGHRFWIPDLNKWVKACELSIGMTFQNIDCKNVEIIDLIIIEQKEKTYNFEVVDLHNYYVGNDQVLSHNKSMKESIFASTDKIDIKFYKIIDSKDEAMYVGQTIQKIGARYDQHLKDPKKASWANKMRGISEIELIEDIPGPYKMTPYEAAVVELYEINNKKGTTKSIIGIKNKSKPIGKRKFDYFKEHGNFNPCLF